MAPDLPLTPVMRILVTGGSGVIGTGTVTELLRRKHSVVLVSRHARDDAAQWPHGVSPHVGDISDATSLRYAATGCDAVMHLAGIVEESPPDTTFERVNVEGTKNIIAEAERAGVARFVLVSSLGAPVGTSDYHVSKQKAEAAARKFNGVWTIVRPGNVYGPGDEQISMLLRLVRGPTHVVPKVGSGDQPFQPIWWEDVARALADVVERADLGGQALDVAGTELTSQNDLLERFSAITGRDIHSIALPEFIATLGAKAVSLVGWDVSFTDDQFQMLREGNVIAPGTPNGLTGVLGITPTPLDTGLRALADLQPEQLPTEGIGPLKRKRFWADVAGSTYTPESLFAVFCMRFNDVTPVFVEACPEPASNDAIQEGETITLALPLRGHVQVRVTGLEARRVTLITLVGHPLAGAVRFVAEQLGTDIRFQVEVYERAANVIDLIAMRTIGDRLQDHTWTRVVESVVRLSGGEAPRGVEHERASLSEEEAAHVIAWLAEITTQRKRAENAETIAAAG